MPASRLNANQIPDIKMLIMLGVKLSAIAKRFGVEYQSIYLIREDRSYKKVPWPLPKDIPANWLQVNYPDLVSKVKLG